MVQRFILVALTFATLACASARSSAAFAQSPQCTATELSREPLMVEGRALHIEPRQLVYGEDGDLLLLGVHNLLFEKHVNGNWTDMSGDSILGVVIRTDGAHKLVKSTIPMRRLAEPRAAHLRQRRFAVTFVELPEYTGEERPDTIETLWHLTLEDGQWTAEEQIVMPDSGRVSAMYVSPLVRFGDSLALALLYKDFWPRDVIVFVRTGTGWTFETVPTRYALYPNLAHSRANGLLLAAVYPDPLKQSDGNSLFLWRRTSTWNLIGKVAGSETGHVHYPTLHLEGGSSILAWRAELRTPFPSEGALAQLRMVVSDSTGGLIGSPENWIALHPRATGSAKPISAKLQDSRVWAAPANNLREMHLVKQQGKEAEIIGRFTNPFGTTLFQMATTTLTNEVLIIGTATDHSPIEAHWGKVPVTLLWRLKIACRSGRGEPD
jgi:hypothetical protein